MAAPTKQRNDMQPNNTTIGMLINISFKKFNPKRRNAKAEEEYAAAHGTKRSVNRTVTTLIPQQFIEPLQKIETEARDTVKKLSAPFEDGGNRLVTAMMVPTIQDAIARLKQRWEFALDDFIGEWDKILEQAKQDLNGDFWRFAAYYPPAEQVRNAFKFSVAFMPMPDSSRLLDAVREEMDELYEQRMEAAGRDLRQRLIDKLRHLSERCALVGGEDKTRFYETNVTNVLELVDLLPKMLLREDPQLMTAIEEAREMLDGLDADAIKSSPTLAQSIKSQADAILSAL